MFFLVLSGLSSGMCRSRPETGSSCSGQSHPFLNPGHRNAMPSEKKRAKEEKTSLGENIDQCDGAVAFILH